MGVRGRRWVEGGGEDEGIRRDGRERREGNEMGLRAWKKRVIRKKEDGERRGNTNIQTHSEKYIRRKADRQHKKDKDRQTDRQTGRETDKQTEKGK